MLLLTLAGGEHNGLVTPAPGVFYSGLVGAWTTVNTTHDGFVNTTLLVLPQGAGAPAVAHGFAAAGVLTAINLLLLPLFLLLLHVARRSSAPSSAQASLRGDSEAPSALAPLSPGGANWGALAAPSDGDGGPVWRSQGTAAAVLLLSLQDPWLPLVLVPLLARPAEPE